MLQADTQETYDVSYKYKINVRNNKEKEEDRKVVEIFPWERVHQVVVLNIVYLLTFFIRQTYVGG